MNISFKILTDGDILARLEQMDSFLSAKYCKLEGRNKYLAVFGLSRHFSACDRLEVRYGGDAVREILQDAANGISYSIENEFNKTDEKSIERLQKYLR